MRPKESSPYHSPDRGSESGKDLEPRMAVRVLPLTFISVKELRDDLYSGKSFDEIELTRTAMGIKSKISKVSAGLLMPMGGKVRDKETPFQTARRKIRKESLLYPMGGRWWEDEPLYQPIEGGYTYEVLGRERTNAAPKRPRKVIYVPYPMLPPEYTRLRPRNPETAKIAAIDTFSPEEFRELVEYGELGRIKDETGPLGQLDQPLESFDVAGSLTKQDKRDIRIDEENRRKKNQVLDRVADRLFDFENLTRLELLDRVNRTRARSGIPKLESLSQTDDQGIPVADPGEIARAFQELQIFRYLKDEQIREREGVPRPPPGLDLLKYAWYASGEGMDPLEMTSLMFEAPSKNIRNTIRDLVVSLRRAFVEVEKEGGASAGGEDINLSDFRHGISAAWIRENFEAMEPVERADYLRQVDDVCLREFARHKGVTPKVVKQVKAEVDQFFQYLVDQSMQVDPEFKKYIQPHKVLNEVVGSRLTRLILLANGISPYSPYEGISDDRLRRQTAYEATRHLVFISKGIEAYKRYEELLENGKEPIEAVINSMIFTRPHHEEFKVSGGRYYKVTHRSTRFDIDGERVHIVVDAKPPKDFKSFLRKSFFEPLDEITDVFSRNIIISEDSEDQELQELSGRVQYREFFKKRLKMAGNMIERMKYEFERASESSGWSVEFAGEKDTFLRLDFEPDELKRQEAYGKRPGSKGENIIRKKFYVIMKDPHGREYAEEIILYPIESFKGTPYQDVLWGHQEKLEDDAAGGYNFRRLTEPEPGYPDLPSLYVLWYPPHLYYPQTDALYFSDVGSGAESGSQENFNASWIDEEGKGRVFDWVEFDETEN